MIPPLSHFGLNEYHPSAAAQSAPNALADEDDVLGRLADLTATHDPLTAARIVFGR